MNMVSIWSALKIKDADCLVFAVAHNEFKNMGWDQIDGLFGDFDNSEKVIIDVKNVLNKDELNARGYSNWRL